MFKTIISKLNSGSERTIAVKKNIIGSLFLKGISILISLLLLPITLGYVNAEMYGIWLTLSSIMMWLNFFDVGFTLGLKNKLAEAIALNDWERGKKLVSTTYVLMLTIFLPLAIILVGVAPFVNWSTFLNVPQIYNVEIIKAIYVVIICFSCQMIANVIVAVAASFQRVAFSNSFNVIGNCLSLVFIYLLTKFAPSSLMLLAVAISAAPIFVLLMASILLYRGNFKNVAPSLSEFRKDLIKDLFSLGFKFFLIQIQVVVLYQTTNILISNLSSSVQVTEYNVAYRYLGIGMMLYSIMLQPLWPAFTDAFAKKDFIWMNSIYKKMAKIYFASLVLLLLMAVASSFVYKIWVGDKVSVSVWMTIAVALYMAIHSWDQLQVQLINGTGYVKLQVYVTTVGLILHIPLSFVLGQYVGGIGVVVSMIIINTIYATFFTTQIHKILKNKASGIWKK